jgi:mono/diheme cytochrome c family protein
MRLVSLIAGAVGGFMLAATADAHGKCRTCHDLQYLEESAGIPRSAWSDLLDSMKQYGLELAPDDRKKILDYLATYLGPNPPPKTATAAPAAPATAKIDGGSVFRELCSACHQANGQGIAGQFPPLAGNHDLFLPKHFAPTVVLHGMEGPIEVNGKPFNGAMPPFNFLSDEQIAAVIRYVQSAWGNDALQPKSAKTLDAAAVAALRKQALSGAQVLALRHSLKGTATGR